MSLGANVWSIMLQKIISSVSVDFLSQDHVTVDCKQTRIVSKKSFSLNINNNHPYHCTDLLGTVSMHRPEELPPTSSFVFFNYDSLINLILKPKIISTDESLKRYSPGERKCFFINERKLKYYTKYTKHIRKSAN